MLQLMLHKIERWTSAKIWLVLFSITLSVILMVQLVILPYFFSQWHAGDGLLVGGDWLAFHRTAKGMAENIRAEGWSAWELWPNGWMPAGIAGALYALFYSKPWVLAPLNAAVHATSGIVLLSILSAFTRKRIAAMVGVLPFIAFPSAMLLYAQIHRDGYNVLGMLLFILGALLIVRINNKQSIILTSEVTGLFYALAGIVIIWLSRPHVLVIYQYMILLISALTVIFLLFCLRKSATQWKEIFVKLFLFIFILGITVLLSSFKGSEKYERSPFMYSSGKAIYTDLISSGSAEQLWASNSVNINLFIAGDDDTSGEKDFVWHRSSILPERIDNHFYSIALLRSVTYPMLYGDSASSIDKDVSFNSALDFLFYLPRALQIAFFAPFPSDWFGEGSYMSTTFFRRVSALEMVFIYLMLIPLLYAAWLWRKKIELYILLFFCTVMMLPIVYSVPNLGTIYRYRYGYLMLLVSLAVAALSEFLVKRKGQDGENTDSSRV